MLDRSNVSVSRNVRQTNFGNLVSSKLRQLIFSTITNDPVPSIQADADVWLADRFGQSQKLFSRLDELKIVLFLIRRCLQSQTDFDRLRRKLGRQIGQARTVTIEILLERKLSMRRSDLYIAASTVQLFGQIQNRIDAGKLLVVSRIVCIQIYWQAKRTDLHFGALQELAGKLFAQSSMTAQQVSHVDFDRIEFVSKSQLDHLVLATRNSQAIAIQDFFQRILLVRFIYLLCQLCI